MKPVDEMRTFFQNATISTNPAGDRVVLADALDAAGLASGKRPVRGGWSLWGLTMKSPITRLAIAAVVIVGVVTGIYMMGGSKPAFADVVKPILTARTAVYKIVANMGDKPALTVQGEFMEPGLVRHTMSFGQTPGQETVQIMDYVQGKGIVLVPAQKMAMFIEPKDKPDELQPEMVNQFQVLRERIRQAQENPDGSVTYLGESRIEGRKTIGYRIAEKGVDMRIWADAGSLLPLQIEYSMEELTGEPVTAVMTDIEFDLPLDPAEFSLAVPEGYTCQTVQVDASVPKEADLVETLRIWAEKTDGKFPSELNMASLKELDQASDGKGPQPDKEKGFADPVLQEFMQFFQKIMRGLAFASRLPKDSDWHYVGKDATFGDATKPIFWYRPQGSATYRVIYADLSVLDVAPEDLPK